MRRIPAPWQLAGASLVSLAVGVAAGLALAPSHDTKPNKVTTPTTAATTGSPAAPGTNNQATGPTRAPIKPPQGKWKPGLSAGAGKAGSRISLSGTGPRTLGSFTLTRAGTLTWTNTGSRFEVLYGKHNVVVKSTAHAGKIVAPAGTYRNVRVSASGSWTLRTG